MNIKRMHHEIKLKYNKLNSNHKKDLPPAFIDDFINDVSLHLVQMVYGANTLSKYHLFGFEVTNQMRDLLSNMVIKFPEQQPITPKHNEKGVYEFDLNDLKYDYLHYGTCYIITDCGRINVHIDTHKDINTSINDPYSRSSKVWKRILGTIGKSSTGENSSIYLYTNDLFSFKTGLYIEYVKQPKKVFFGGYDTLEYQHEGKGYQKTDLPVNSEIHTGYHNLIVDLAVQEISKTLHDDYQYKTTQEKILTKIN